MKMWVIRVTFISASCDIGRFSALSKRFRGPIGGNNFISQREFREALADGAGGKAPRGQLQCAVARRNKLAQLFPSNQPI
jgi:hypothetical protein